MRFCLAVNPTCYRPFRRRRIPCLPVAGTPLKWGMRLLWHKWAMPGHRDDARDWDFVRRLALSWRTGHSCRRNRRQSCRDDARRLVLAQIGEGREIRECRKCGRTYGARTQGRMLALCRRCLVVGWHEGEWW